MNLGTDYRLVQARDTREGDEILFQAAFANYTVEDIDTDPIGNVRHRHGDGSASSSYHPGELLRVKIQPDPITAYYTDKARPGQPPALPR